MFVDDERFDLGFFQQYYQCTVTLTFDLETRLIPLQKVRRRLAAIWKR